MLSEVEAQNVGINTTGNAPNPKATLDISSTTGGLLIPRMTTAERNALAASATENGLQIFNTDVNCFQAYINGQWQNMYCDLGCSAAPATPGSISGSQTPCQNATGITYSIAQVAGATSYNWSVPSGATITAGQGTTGIVVTFATTNGNVSVTASNNCGTSAAQTLAITLNTVPAQPDAISGNVTVCQNDNGVAYSVTNVAGVAYAWTFPGGTGFTCASGCATNSITADFSGTATSGTLTVTPSNACGNGTARTLDVTVNSVPAAPAAASHTPSATQIIWDWNNAAGATGYKYNTVNNYGTATDNGASSTYTQTGLTCNTAYTLYVWAYNACGNSTATTLNQTTSACGPSCGTQVWASANLDVGTRINRSVSQTNNATVEKWCYNDVDANCTTYGGQYQWNELMNYAASVSCDPCDPPTTGVQGLCPAGYHVPSDLEWSRYEYCIENNISPTGSTTLATFQTGTGYRGSSTAGVGPGSKMKAAAGNPWGDGASSTNTSGFTALPGGWSSGISIELGTSTYFRSATENGSSAWIRFLVSGNAQSRRDELGKSTGFSARCLQD